VRLVHLTDDDGATTRLHPLVSVVAPSGPTAVAIRRTVAGLARGEAAGTGLLEAHGVLFPLSADLLALLDIEPGVEPIVSVGEVPTRPPTPEALARRAAATRVEERASAAAEAEERLADAEALAEQARTAQAEAQQALDEATARAEARLATLDALTGQLDHAKERQRSLAEELAALAPKVEAAAERRAALEADHAEVRGRRIEAEAARVEAEDGLALLEAALDPEAGDAVREATEAYEQLAAEGSGVAVDGTDLDANLDRDATEAELQRTLERIEELERQLAAVPADPSIDASAIRHALDVAIGTAPIPVVLDPAAQFLADELAGLGTGDDDHERAGRLDPTAAKSALDDAQQAVLEAERAVRGPSSDPVLIEQLEAAHLDLLDALERAESRFSGARADRRVEECRAAENRLLDALGFASYSAYMMGSSVAQVDDAKVAALAEARRALVAAEAAWGRALDHAEQELDRAGALDRRRVLLTEAADLLGRPVAAEDAVAALRSHHVPAVSPQQARTDLAVVLGQAGLELDGADLALDDLVILTEALLAELAAGSTGSGTELAAELASLVEARDELTSLLEGVTGAAGAADAAADAAAAWAAELAALALVRDDAQERAAAHDRAAAEVDAQRAALDEARRVEAEAAEVAATADATVAGAQADEGALREHQVVLEAQLADAEAAERDADRELARLAASTDDDPAERARLVEDRSAEREAAEAAVMERRAEVDAAAAALRSAEAELSALPTDVGSGAGAGAAGAAEEAEWYLLARLAAQRSASLAGGLPMLLDGALAGLDPDGVVHVLQRMERMAAIVQIVVLSDDPHVEAWAREAGPERAVLVADAAS
jgi:hypothetical protein